MDEGAALVWAKAAGAGDGGRDGVSGRLEGAGRDGADGGVSPAGRGEQAVSKKRTVITSQFRKTLAFGAKWVYNLS